MKKTIMLTIIAVFVIGAAASAANVQVALRAGNNLLAPPVVPLNPAPASVFKDDTGTPLSLVNLTRYDAVSKGYKGYDPDPDLDEYGNVLMGDGSWITLPAAATWQYDGAPDGLATDNPPTQATMTDMWISLPKTGYSLIGTPFNHPIHLASCALTNGTTTIKWDDAAAAVWVIESITGYFGGSYQDVGTDPDIYDHTTIDPGHGYWISTRQNNLALMIPCDDRQLP